MVERAPRTQLWLCDKQTGTQGVRLTCLQGVGGLPGLRAAGALGNGSVTGGSAYHAGRGKGVEA